ncbi:membrane protein insertion efficiency factor YidD [Corynebacterium choanae]|uniref:membrane protein insertion efficiency factor YidD n=1 Tax=Corynebacterium choanae TaxID=1862358 RepID=UPI000F4DCE6A|nr:membrane protein insertion efficiency factor YidD [Corynebacterium choanae]
MAGDPQRPATRIIIRLIRWYQHYISPLKNGSTCRFEPTCSAYGLQAITTAGPLKGSLLTIARISKCGPWHPGGFDPPPGWQDPSQLYEAAPDPPA